MHTPIDRRRLTMLHEMGVRVWARTPHARATRALSSDASDSSNISSDSATATTKPSEPASTRSNPAFKKPILNRIATSTPAPAPASTPKSNPQTTDSAAIHDCSSMDWEQLESLARTCQSCPLHQQRTQAVFDKGQRDASIFILGEAPGVEEDRQGLPFVGKSGQLLDRMLCAIGGGPKQAMPSVYIANTLKCRPPANRNPDAAELAQCRPFWERQIALVQPKVILALGRFASQALLNSNTPLGKLRGHLHQYQEIPVLVSYHPAYLLRNPSDKAKVWADLCLIQQLLDRNEV